MDTAAKKSRKMPRIQETGKIQLKNQEGHKEDKNDAGSNNEMVRKTTGQKQAGYNAHNAEEDNVNTK